jgi:peptidoglycan hydrolase-like protein with peptidoglycan-binding domain
MFSVAGLVLGLLLVWTHPASAERRVALVIGNSAYQNAPALPDPARDAQAMVAMFQKAGFDVVSAQSDVGISQLKRAVAQFADDAARSDIAVVYYAGYSIDIQGINYLIPVDAKLAHDRDAVVEAITLDTLAKSVDGAKRLRLVILDASRDDPFASSTRQQHNSGLAEPDPKPGTLIAYAATAGFDAEDGDAEHSTYTGALLHNLFTPGLDIRLAFVRILVDVLRKTSKRQVPFVYGSQVGGNIALVPAPTDRPAVDLAGEKIDYSVLVQIATVHAWEVFLVQHPAGFYSNAAREQLRIAEAAPPKPATPPPRPTPGERQAALERAPDATPGGRLPPVNSPELVSLAQLELTRLGCFSGAADGALDDATRAAIRLYLKAHGETLSDADITDDFIAELRKQTARVCPLVCPAGKIANGERCVDIDKSKAIAAPKGSHDRPKTVTTSPAKPERAPMPAPRVTQQAPSRSGSAGPTPGVGF